MKILHILNSSSFSGAENVVCQIIKMYKNTDFTMAYCSRDGKIRDVLKEKNIDFQPISNMSVGEIDRIIEEYKPDVLHAHDMRAAYISSKNRHKIPVVCHIHNNAFDSRRISKKSVAFLLASFRISHIFWVSDESMKQYIFSKYVKKKSSVLHNIIDVDSLLSKVNEDKTTYSNDLVYVGRLSEEKNPMRLLEIVSEIKKSKYDISLSVVGDGIYKEIMEKEVIDKGLTSNVIFYGFLNNPYKLVKDSSIMIMTSIREGLPMCILEALSLGTPVISTPVGAIKDIITDGTNGFLCNENSEFSNRIIEILNNDQKHVSMSLQAASFAKQYNDKSSFMSSLSNVYIEAVKS